MSDTFELRKNDTTGVALSSCDPTQLAAILKRNFALTIWWRPVPVIIPKADLSDFVSIRLKTAVGDVAADVGSVLNGTESRDWHAPLTKDIANLASRFAKLMSAEGVAIRLEPIPGNACWKFHADDVSARLITTYVGPGTEWTIRQGNQLGRIHQIVTGHVGVFKGRHWAPDAPILHRSPPIADTDQVRLLLVIDPLG
ncbi:DUF1826 domain-containing protein [Sphingomonas sp. UYP23]